MDERLLEKAKELNFEITDELDQLIEFAFYLGRESFCERMKIGKLNSLKRQGRPIGASAPKIRSLAVLRGYIVMTKAYRNLSLENKLKVDEILRKVKKEDELANIKKYIDKLYNLEIFNSLKNTLEP